MWYLPRFCGRMAHLFFVCVQRKLARSNHNLSAKILLTLQLCFNMIWIHTYVLWLHALKMKLSMASISSPLLLYYRPGRRFWNQVGYGLKVSRSWNKNCNVVTSPKKWTNEFIFLSWWSRNIWNLNFDFKFQVFQDRQDKKINWFVFFWGGEKFQLNNFVLRSNDLYYVWLNIPMRNTENRAERSSNCLHSYTCTLDYEN